MRRVNKSFVPREVMLPLGGVWPKAEAVLLAVVPREVMLPMGELLP